MNNNPFNQRRNEVTLNVLRAGGAIWPGGYDATSGEPIAVSQGIEPDDMIRQEQQAIGVEVLASRGLEGRYEPEPLRYEPETVPVAVVNKGEDAQGEEVTSPIGEHWVGEQLSLFQ